MAEILAATRRAGEPLDKPEPWQTGRNTRAVRSSDTLSILLHLGEKWFEKSEQRDKWKLGLF